ncbi:MAG: acyl-CoA dehydrogenase family protein, partial [Bdellovibrionales bacterium]|nr:acyl-CoA dehydrogenase family protein [Bdellovibrionales bacterium]
MFTFENQEQHEIRSSVRKLAKEQIPQYQNETYFGTVPRALFNTFAELGLTGLSVPEAFGGLGAGPLTTAIVMEELSAVDMGCSVFLGVHSM